MVQVLGHFLLGVGDAVSRGLVGEAHAGRLVDPEHVGLGGERGREGGREGGRERWVGELLTCLISLSEESEMKKLLVFYFQF